MAFIDKKIEDLINYRIVEEEKSSRLYLAMSKWLGFNGYTGAAKLWAEYSAEETEHAGWSYFYLEALDLLPKVQAIEKPVTEFKSLPDICKLSYEHEMVISNQCNDLAKAAQATGDYMTIELAQKYLVEQRDEIAKTTHWLDRLEAFGTSPEALRLLDNEMGG